MMSASDQDELSNNTVEGQGSKQGESPEEPAVETRSDEEKSLTDSLDVITESESDKQAAAAAAASIIADYQSAEASREEIIFEGDLPSEVEVSAGDEIPPAEETLSGEDIPPIEEFQAVDEIPAEDDDRSWFVVHCYSGYENKVRHNLEQRIETMGMKDMIFDVVVPTEEEIEVKEGKRRTVERRVFPGYILVNMIMSEESWYVVRNTPGVTGFVGMGATPTPLRTEEVAQIIKRMEADAPRIKVTFKPGERVRIVDGPFNDFRGTVNEIDMERAKVRVMVNFFGRETPIELDFLQVEKA
jgi:transcriptional antiterminator NusG